MRRLARDPALLVTVLVLWALLGLFVLFPMAKLSWLAFFEGGRLSLGHVWTILADPNHRQAFANSLLLAALVGVGGTALGFLFAYTAARGGLGRGSRRRSTRSRSCRSSPRPSRRPSP